MKKANIFPSSQTNSLASNALIAFDAQNTNEEKKIKGKKRQSKYVPSTVFGSW